MRDLIDRNMAITHIYVALFPNVSAEEKADKALRELPTVDAVEVVRCKDCKHKEREQPGMVYCPMMVGSWVADDHFCAWGERRTDETDS